MHRMTVIFGLVALMVVALLLVGCPAKQQAQAPVVTPDAVPPSHTMPGGEKMAGETHAEEAGKTDSGDVTAAGDQQMASCLVLGTTMPKDKMIAVEHEGKTYYFCCPPCVDKFKADPDKYIKNPAPPKPAGEDMH